MLWVSSQYKCFWSYSAGIDFRRQNLTSKVGPRAERVITFSVCVFFSSFEEAEIADAISASNDEKYFRLWKLFDQLITTTI